MIDALSDRFVLLFIAVILDWVVKDPYWMPHPIRLFGNIISIEENIIRKTVKTPKGKRIAGFFMAIFNMVLVSVSVFCIYRSLPSKWRKVFEILVYYFSLSAGMLSKEGRLVEKSLSQSIEKARVRVSYIVGRDTTNMDEESIIKATVETVSENTSDGVIAPLFYIVLLGPVGGFLYKFVNTMDSMVGYKNDKYIDIGKYPAFIDDVFNYIPARLTGVLMIISSLNLQKIVHSSKIMWRDRKNHSGPNPAWPEGATAALLGVQLGGGGVYSGKYIDKPTIGDDTRPVTRDDITRSTIIMYKTEILMLIFIFLLALKYSLPLILKL